MSAPSRIRRKHSSRCWASRKRRSSGSTEIGTQIMQTVQWDFATILSLLTLLTGIVWVLDKLWLGPKRRAKLGVDAVDKPNAFVDFCRSEEHTSELQSLMRISYAVFCLKKKKTKHQTLHPP